MSSPAFLASTSAQKLKLTVCLHAHSYDDFGGVVLSDGEGERIAAAAGNAKGVLLVNHGLLTVGKTIREACFWFIVLERLCKTQLLIEAAAAGGRGMPKTIKPEVAEWTGSVTGSHVSGYHGAEMVSVAQGI